MTKEINYKQTIQQGIPLIQEWLNKQTEDIKKSEEYKEIIWVIKEIINEEDWSKESYLDIQFILKPFQEQLPLKIKRIFNSSTLDNYTVFLSSMWLETIVDHINLIQVSKRYELNMTKFFYNPIPLTFKTRDFFPYLRTLYVYSLEEIYFCFENYYEVKTIKECKIKQYDLWYNQVKQIEKWTTMKCGEIIFDSDIDDWSQYEPFNSRVYDRNNLVFLIEDEEGQKFGGYINAKIDKTFITKNRWRYKGRIDDPNAFLFLLQSNGSLNQMMKFDIYYKSESFILNDNYKNALFLIGQNREFCWNITIRTKPNKSQSIFCKNANQQIKFSDYRIRGEHCPYTNVQFFDLCYWF